MKRRGFTLVELLAVIAILAILVIIALPNVMGMFNNAKKSTFETELKKIYRGAEQAYVGNAFSGSGTKKYIKAKSECSKELDMSIRDDLYYYIEINSEGKIVKFYAYDNSYQFEYDGEMTINDIKDIEDVSTAVEIVTIDCDCGTTKITDKITMFISGPELNIKMKELSGQTNPTIETVNESITAFKRSTERPNESIMTDDYKVSTGVTPIYMWYDNGTIYYYCEEDNIYLNVDSSYMFNKLINLSNVSGVDNINTSNTKDMSFMFYEAGVSSQSFNMNISSWDTSKVTNMGNMLNSTGNIAETCSIGNLSSWNTSNVRDMNSMFTSMCSSSELLGVDGFQNWDVSKVKTMKRMFFYFGSSVPSINIDLSSWKTSSVEDISEMFYGAGHNATTVEFNLTGWNTSKVTNMMSMFCGAGNESNSFIVKGLSGFDTSKVIDMSHLFSSAGAKATTWEIDDISGWNTSNVTNMIGLFRYAAQYASKFEIDLSRWDVSKVTMMSDMFSRTGCYATTWSIGNLSNWDTRNVTNMNYMFENAGSAATTWNDIGTLNVYATKLNHLFHYCKNAKAILNIYSDPTNYDYAFTSASYVNGSGMTVNYSSTTTNIDYILWTKSSNSNIVKGSQLD